MGERASFLSLHNPSVPAGHLPLTVEALGSLRVRRSAGKAVVYDAAKSGTRIILCVSLYSKLGS